jgi:hypothetical protein
MPVTTAEQLEERARDLAQQNVDVERGADDLLACCGSKRVSVVVARGHFSEALENDPNDSVARRALEMLDAALHRGDWTTEEAV